MESYFHSFQKIPPNDIEDGIQVKTIGLPNVELRYMEFAPGTMIPKHTHSETVVTLILEGKMEFTVARETKKVSKGDLFIVPANTEHSGSTGDKKLTAVSWSSKGQ